MTRLIAVLAFVVGLFACSDTPQAHFHATPSPDQCADIRFHGALQESGCVYEVQELAAEKGLNASPVWVFYGFLHKHSDDFRLHAEDDPQAAFMALDLTKLPASEIPYGLEPLISWRTRIIGYYTSRDITTPAVADAVGTLQVVRIGYIGDPTRPRGAYADAAARESGEAEKTH